MPGGRRGEEEVGAVRDAGVRVSRGRRVAPPPGGWGRVAGRPCTGVRSRRRTEWARPLLAVANRVQPPCSKRVGRPHRRPWWCATRGTPTGQRWSRQRPLPTERVVQARRELLHAGAAPCSMTWTSVTRPRPSGSSPAPTSPPAEGSDLGCRRGPRALHEGPPRGGEGGGRGRAARTSMAACISCRSPGAGPWLASSPPPGSAILCLPLGEGSSEEETDQRSRLRGDRRPPPDSGRGAGSRGAGNVRAPFRGPAPPIAPERRRQARTKRRGSRMETCPNGRWLLGDTSGRDDEEARERGGPAGVGRGRHLVDDAEARIGLFAPGSPP